MKKLITIIMVLMVLPVYAGVYEDALKSNKSVLLYIYTSDCSACKKFTPVYNQLAKSHPDVKFVKADADTLYGLNLLKKFKGRYIPYVVMTDSKTKKSSVISPYCTVDKLCLERALKAF